MSTQDNITVIEDEPYKGLFLGVGSESESEVALPAGKAARDVRRSMTTREVEAPSVDPQALASLLSRTREALGYSLEQVADITRVRRAYLEAFEQAAYDRLPSRAFAIGYIKAYAKALGLDEESLADSFKRNFADPGSQSLRAPVGTAFEDLKPNYKIYGGVIVGVIGAVVAWNLFQRSPDLSGVKREEGDLTARQWSPGVPLVRGGILISQAAAAPPDQDLPVAYYTPGLEDGFMAIDAERAQADGTPASEHALQIRKAFNPRGAVFGAVPSESSVTIQARKSVNLVLRDTAGTVYFARQLGAGEAYRVPNVPAVPMLVDVGDPKAFEVYYNGEYAGGIDDRETPISRLNAKAAAAAKLMDTQLVDKPAPVVQAKPPVVVNAEVRPQVPERDGPLPYIPAQRPVQTPPAEDAPQTPPAQN